MKNIGSGRDYNTLADYLAALKGATETDYEATCFDSPTVPPADWDYSANPVKIYAQTPTNGLEGVGIELLPASGNCAVASGNADIEFIGFEVAIPDDGDGYNAAAIDEANTRLRMTKCLFKRHTTSNGNGGLAAANSGAHVILTDCWLPCDQDVPYIGIGAFSPGASRVFLRDCKVALNSSGVGAGTAFIAGEGSAKVIFNNLQVIDVDGDMAALFGSNVEAESGTDGNLITTADGTVITYPACNVAYDSEDPADLIQSLDLSAPDLRWKSRAAAVARPGADLSALANPGIDGVLKVTSEDKTIIGGENPPLAPVIDATFVPHHGHKDQNYVDLVETTQGRGPFTWSLDGEPAGLTIADLDAGDGVNYYGQFQGFPITDDPGTYPITIHCTDSYGQSATPLEVDFVVEAAQKLEFDPSIVALGSTPEGAPSSAQQLDITTAMGETIGSPVPVTRYGNVELSLDGSTWFSTSFNLTPVAGSITQTIYMRIPGAAAEGSFSGGLQIGDMWIPYYGTVAAPEAAMRVRRNAVDGPVMASGDMLTFGNVPIGSAGAWKRIFVVNETAGTLTLQSPALSGEEPGEFELDFSGIDLTLDADQSTSFRVRFKPTALGSNKGADLTFEHDDPESASPFAIGLVGDAVMRRRKTGGPLELELSLEI